MSGKLRFDSVKVKNEDKWSGYYWSQFNQDSNIVSITGVLCGRLGEPITLEINIQRLQTICLEIVIFELLPRLIE